jgi:hypothetical protein
MLYPVLFTFTPDYNRPRDSDGTRVEYLRGKYQVEAYRNGDLREGDTAIAYFDPEGPGTFEYDAGWSSPVTILRIEVVDNFGAAGAEALRIVYKDIKAEIKEIV